MIVLLQNCVCHRVIIKYYIEDHLVLLHWLIVEYRSLSKNHRIQNRNTHRTRTGKLAVGSCPTKVPDLFLWDSFLFLKIVLNNYYRGLYLTFVLV